MAIFDRQFLALIVGMIFTFGILSSQLAMADADGYAGVDTKPAAKSEKSEGKKSKSKKEGDSEEEEDKDPTLEEVVEDYEKIDGLFPLYRDKETGGLMMEIAADKVDKEFIYTSQTVDGAADVGFGHIRGAYLSEDVISIRKHYNKIEFVKEVTSLYFDPDNALANAAKANVAPAIVAVAEITAKSKDETRYLIDADSIFLTEALQQVTPSPDPNPHPGASDEPPFSLGHFNSEKSKVLRVGNYPENLDVVVSYSYDNETPMNYGGDDIADGRNVSVSVQHSFVAMPDGDFEPRFDDYRVGYFFNKVTDMTSTEPTPYRDVINRWRLQKKDPTQALSEPVKPITYWIENTTPVEHREAVREGILVWNKAFEKAGFKNAIEAKVQPDDAEWDAGDIRYNVIRWISSTTIGYSGYGPSFANPRTGEILGADIMINFDSLNLRISQEHIFGEAALFDYETAGSSLGGKTDHFCVKGQAMQQNLMFALTVLDGAMASPENLSELVHNSLVDLIAHEVGHTLGLSHNFRASQLHSPTDIHNKDLTSKMGMLGSVMDYNTINVASDPAKQGHYFFGNLGPYDLWAVEFGYTPSLSDSEQEEARVDALLARSTEPELAFGNDTDSIISSTSGIDPRIMLWDMSNDVITYSNDRMELVDRKLADLKETYQPLTDTWHDFRQAYLILTGQKSNAARAVSRYVGGVYLERADRGQEGEKQPYTPVPRAEQERAMDSLRTYIFAPDAFAAPAELFAHLQPQRRGNVFGRPSEDPKIHDRALRIQSQTLTHLLHPATLKRVTDSALYGNDYAAVEVVSDLTDAIFEDDLKGSVNTFRQNLQVFYVQRLIGAATGMAGHDNIAQSAADYNLRRIERMMRQGRRPDMATDAHRRRVIAMIEMALYGDPSRR